MGTKPTVPGAPQWRASKPAPQKKAPTSAGPKKAPTSAGRGVAKSPRASRRTRGD